MTTPVRPFREQRERLQHGALRWLLGARPQIHADGGVSHSSIVRLRYLHAKKPLPSDWDRYLGELWDTHKAAIQAWHLRHWPRKRPPRTPLEAARNYRARHG